MSLTGDRLSLFVYHLSGNKPVLKGCVSVSEASPLLFLLLSRRPSISGGLD
jgi:hypothetical protein